MKYLIFVIVTCIALQTQATMQRPDLVMYDGVLYELHTPMPNKDLPLKSAWSERNERPSLSEGPNGLMTSACWRGYVAIWQIEDGVLYLAGLNAWQEDRKADLKELFPKRYMKGRVKADWFSGDLILSVRRWKGKSVTLMFAKGELYTRINHEEMKEKETKPSSSEANDSITIFL